MILFGMGLLGLAGRKTRKTSICKNQLFQSSLIEIDFGEARFTHFLASDARSIFFLDD
jgi:hypothetical protein